MTSGGGGHPDYHDTGDDIDFIEPEILRKTGQFVLQATLNLGNESKTLIIPNRQDIFNASSWNIAIINPAIKVERGWTVLDADCKDGLAKLINEKITELKAPKDDNNNMFRFYRNFRGGSSYNKGLKGPSVFANDPVLLSIAKTALGFGRLDVCGKDSVWFNDGFTNCGKKGWKTAEENKITIALTAPCPVALKDVLEVAEKPFILKGMKELSDELVTALNEKKVIVTVDFDPANVSGCVDQLELLQKVFGDKDNLLLNVLDKDNLDSAKKELYMALLTKGWTHEEIYAIGGAGKNRGSSGNLDALRALRGSRNFGRR